MPETTKEEMISNELLEAVEKYFTTEGFAWEPIDSFMVERLLFDGDARQRHLVED